MPIMSAPSSPAFEIFTPLEADDFPLATKDFSDIITRVTETVHGVYKEVEQEALSVPEEATVASETAALLGALPFHQARYYGKGILLSAHLGSAFDVTYATAAEWGTTSEGDLFKPVLTFETSVKLVTRKQPGPEAAVSALAIELNDLNDKYRLSAEPLISEHPSLMGIAGEPVHSKFLRRIKGHSYGTEEQAAIKAKLGEVFADDHDVRLDIKTHIAWTNPLLFAQAKSILEVNLPGPKNHNGTDSPTPAHLSILGLRAAQVLIKRG